MSASRLSVRFALGLEERTLVARGFVEPLYAETYGTTPPLADVYAIVELEGVIRACLGIEWPDKDGLLPIERTYGISGSMHEWPLTAENKMQCSRWASVLPQAGALAVYAAARYGLARGRIYALVEHNAVIHRRSKLLGIDFRDMPHGPVDLSLIREENRGFYAKSDMRPYLMDLRQTEEALKIRIPPFIARET